MAALIRLGYYEEARWFEVAICDEEVLRLSRLIVILWEKVLKMSLGVGLSLIAQNRRRALMRAGVLCFTWCCTARCQTPSGPESVSENVYASAARDSLSTRVSVTDAVDSESRVISGKLTVKAEGSSVATIVNVIAQLYGMRVTGSVTDQPVYGTYGPGDVSAILSSLLRGAGINIILIRCGEENGQVIVSPRNGPATANSQSDARPSSSAMPVATESSYGRGPHEFRGSRSEAQPTTKTPEGGSGTSTASTQPEAATLPRSPNGIKLPNEIKAGLVKLQAEKAQDIQY